MSQPGELASHTVDAATFDPTAASKDIAAVGRPLRMAVIGMDLRRRNLLELVLTGPVRSACVIVGDARAEAAIIDMDSYGAMGLLDTQRRRHPGRPLILTALDQLAEDVVQDDFYLAKPVQVQDLLSALSVISSRLFPPRPEHSANLVHDATFYDPDKYLQGVVLAARQQALTRNRAVYVEGPWPTIMLFPSTGTALVSGGLDALLPYTSRSGLADQAKVTFAPAPLFSPHHPDSLPMDTLVWGVSLAASDGRLPIGTPFDRLCLLQSWPNFTRLANVPGGLAIAALWAREPYELLDTASVLDLAREHVFSFYSAVLALGLLAPAHLAHSRPVTGIGAAEATSTRSEPRRPDRLATGRNNLSEAPFRGLLRRVFDRLSARSHPEGGHQ